MVVYDLRKGQSTMLKSKELDILIVNTFLVVILILIDLISKNGNFFDVMYLLILIISFIRYLFVKFIFNKDK